jgi:hypothetical protein
MIISSFFKLTCRNLQLIHLFTNIKVPFCSEILLSIFILIILNTSFILILNDTSNRALTVGEK